MPTLPDIEAYQSNLQELLKISQAILACQTNDFNQFQVLMNQRDDVIKWLNQHNLQDITVDEQIQLRELIIQLQLVDLEIEKYFKQILNSHATALRHIAKSKQVLSSYKFPVLPQSSGIENQG